MLNWKYSWPKMLNQIQNVPVEIQHELESDHFCNFLKQSNNYSHLLQQSTRSVGMRNLHDFNFRQFLFSFFFFFFHFLHVWPKAMNAFEECPQLNPFCDGRLFTPPSIVATQNSYKPLCFKLDCMIFCIELFVVSTPRSLKYTDNILLSKLLNFSTDDWVH